MSQDFFLQIRSSACEVSGHQFFDVRPADAFCDFAFVGDADGIDPGFDGVVEGTVCQVHEFFRFDADGIALLFHGQGHAEGEFSVIFEDRVRPSRPEAFAVRRIRDTGHCRAPSLGTARSVGDDHARPEELSQDLHVCRFRTTCTCAVEFEERLMELAAFDGEFIEGRMFFRECLGIIPVGAFMTLRFQRFHRQGLSRAGIDAGTAAVAVERRNLDAEFIIFQALANGFLGLEVSRSFCFFISRYQVRTDGSVRADQGAAVTLDAFFQVPFRNVRCDAAFFIFRRTQGVRPVGIGHKFTDWNGITELQVSRFDDFLDEVRNIAGIFDDWVGR